MRVRVWCLFCVVWSVSATAAITVQEFATSLQVRYELIDGSYQPCPPSQVAIEPGCFKARLQLSMPITVDASELPAHWQLLFSHLSPVIDVDSPLFSIQHLNGDVHRLQPTTAFRGFTANQVLQLDFIATASVFSQFYVLGNYWLQDATGHSATVQSTATAPLQDRPAFVLPFSAKTALDRQWQRGDSIYRGIDDAPAKAPSSSTVPRVIPQPKQLQLLGGPGLRQDAELWLDVDATLQQSLAGALQQLSAQMSQQGGQLFSTPQASMQPLRIRLQPSLGAEAYQLEIQQQRVDIRAGDAAGAFYALQTLHSLQAQGSIVALRIDDKPAFAYRGQHVDIARNFFGRPFLERLIVQMARYKLNKLHLHLADDEGWRLAIQALPELTELGARRCYDLTEQRCLLPQLGAGNNPTSLPNGYLSQADYQAIVRIAKAHFIEVIPSIDMPGHGRAAIKAMDLRAKRLHDAGDPNWQQHLLRDPNDQSRYLSIQYYHDNTLNVCVPGTYNFVNTVLNEIRQLHKAAGADLAHYHIGADETAGAWQRSPACQQLQATLGVAANAPVDWMGYFLKRLQQQLRQQSLPVTAWSDGLKHLSAGDAPSVQSYLWQTTYGGASDTAHAQANQGWQVVLAFPDVLYLDAPALEHPSARGNHWASRGVSLRRIFQFHPANLPANALFYPNITHDLVANSDQVPLQAPKHIIGLQGNLWTEVIADVQSAERQLYPRLLAIAERSWHQASWQLPYQKGQHYQAGSALWTAAHQGAFAQDWHQFNRQVWLHEAPYLLEQGIAIQLPWVGVKRQREFLAARTEPGLAIEFRVPGQPWQRYLAPIKAPDDTEFRAVLQFNNGANLQSLTGPVSRVTNDWSGN